MNEWIGIALIALGVLFDLLGCLGLVRLPDVYSRLQAATKCVTLGTCSILVGVFTMAGFSAMGFKALLCAIFVLLTAPVAAHALARGAHRAGFPLWEGSVADHYAAAPARERSGIAGRRKEGPIMKWPKVRELREAIRALIAGPYTSPFPAAPHTPHTNFRGQPRFDANHCLGCLACESVCPVEAIDHRDVLEGEGAPKRIMIHYTDTCIFCGECEAHCIADGQGIQLTQEWELAFFDRAAAYESIEKPLACCERCGEAIGTRDHLQWIAAHLGELSFSNPTLYLSQMQGWGLVDSGGGPVKEGWRPDRFKILCAHCRRETTLDHDMLASLERQ